MHKVTLEITEYYCNRCKVKIEMPNEVSGIINFSHLDFGPKGKYVDVGGNTVELDLCFKCGDEFRSWLTNQ